MLDGDDRITHVSPHLHHELGSWLGHVLWDHLPGAREIYGPCFDEARSSGQPVESVVFYSGRVKRLTVIPAADGLAVHVERLAELDVTSLGTLTRSLAADRGRASWSSVRATRSTSARVSASSSLSAASSTACADAASGERTRSLTVVSVSSATRRSRGSEGVVTPRSQRETVIASTPSASASCFWVRPALRLAVRSRPPTPPLSWAPKLVAVDTTVVGRMRPRRLTRSQRSRSRTRFPHRSQR